jgi:hypothetical protein
MLQSHKMAVEISELDLVVLEGGYKACHRNIMIDHEINDHREKHEVYGLIHLKIPYYPFFERFLIFFCFLFQNRPPIL